MNMPKYGASVDVNQKDIVDALKEIGCQVEIIGRPVDLLVGYRKYNFLIEVKRPNVRPRKDQQAQRDFLKDWKGQVRQLSTVEEAISLVTRAYRITTNTGTGKAR